jgi:hypothetical protein
MNLCPKPSRIVVVVIFYGQYAGPIHYDIFYNEARQNVAQIRANVFCYFLRPGLRHYFLGNPGFRTNCWIGVQQLAQNVRKALRSSRRR